jgi:hypothetical protein
VGRVTQDDYPPASEIENYTTKGAMTAQGPSAWLSSALFSQLGRFDDIVKSIQNY